VRAFERGVRAMMSEGIKVKVDLIVGLPGDSVESVRRGLLYVREEGLYSDVQVFHLSLLPGTAFRHEAADLGLRFQTRPPYYVLQTPILAAGDIISLLAEAQELFEVEFDAPLPPLLMVSDSDGLRRIEYVDLDVPAEAVPSGLQAQAFTLWLRSSNFAAQATTTVSLVRRLLRNNPFTTLQVVLDPKTNDVSALCRSLEPGVATALLAACQEQPTYLDKYYAMHPGSLRSAKRLIVLLPFALRKQLPADWLASWSECASLVWCDGDASEFGAHEFTWQECGMTSG
jgi:hypothetical protein